MRRLRILVLVTLALATVAAPARAAPTGGYVALGDSYAAGPGIPNVVDGFCERSDHNFASVVASTLHVASFRDVSCSGATTGDVFGPQRVELIWDVAPQIDALTEDTALVTVSIGGNDIGFADIVGTCGVLSLLDASGDPCRRSYTAGSVDVLAAAVAAAGPKVAAVLSSIRGHAPRARVVVVGYPEILPANGPGCWPTLLIAAGDVPYLRGIEEQLNATVAAQARLAGDTFVDTYGPSRGHDACQPPGTKWVEGLLPQSPSIPIHPNALGMRGIAGAILSALGAG